MVNKGVRSTAPLPELWGGIECTIARVGDDYRDQTLETGHHLRSSDIDLIADLGVATMRYPILWETVSPDSPDEYDFSWTDDRLEFDASSTAALERELTLGNH